MKIKSIKEVDTFVSNFQLKKCGHVFGCLVNSN